MGKYASIVCRLLSLRTLLPEKDNLNAEPSNQAIYPPSHIKNDCISRSTPNPSGYEVRFLNDDQKSVRTLLVLVYTGTHHMQDVYEDVGKALIWDEFCKFGKVESWSDNEDGMYMKVDIQIGGNVVQDKVHVKGLEVEAPKRVIKDVLVKLQVEPGSPSRFSRYD